MRIVAATEYILTSGDKRDHGIMPSISQKSAHAVTAQNIYGKH